MKKIIINTEEFVEAILHEFTDLETVIQMQQDSIDTMILHVKIEDTTSEEVYQNSLRNMVEVRKLLEKITVTKSVIA
jgi:hypothetical protein